MREAWVQRVEGVGRLVLASWVATATLLGSLMLAPEPAVAQGGVQRGVPYGSDPAQVMDVYVPEGNGPFPALILIHGGRFERGDKSDLDDVALQAAQEGFAAFNMNYRLAPQFPYPDPLNDAEAVVEFVRSHAGEFRVDPQRVGALGSSAGANLAGMLATDGSGPPVGSRVVAAALWSCPCNLATMTELLGSYLGTNPDPETIRAASPIDQVDPSDAPLFIANGTNEKIPVEEARAMADAYADAGIAHQLVIRPEAEHGDRLGSLIMPQTFDFLKTYVAGYPGPATAPTVSPTGEEPSPAGRGERHRAGERRRSRQDFLPLVVLIAAAVLVAGALFVTFLRRSRGRMSGRRP